MKKYVIADIHGRAEAFRGLLKKVKFDYAKDKLIVLGDVVDGGEDSKGVVDELLKIKNLVYIIGNHCYWFMNYIVTGDISKDWYSQGGDATLNSYKGGVPDTHKAFFNYNGKKLHKQNNMVFVHGGINPDIPLEDNDLEFVMWDRDLIDAFDEGVKLPFKKIFIGHSPTVCFGSTVPIIKKSGKTELIMMDTGAGYVGKLTIMDVDSGKFWQSEKLEPSSRVKKW